MEEKRKKIEAFLNKLSKEMSTSTDKPFENPYKNKDSVQYYNLEQYLMFMLEIKPKVMFVGEAPGYKGCQKTGIPFVSEEELQNKVNNFALGEWDRRIVEKPEQENSAKCIWASLREAKLVPLIWNAFPFHPYEPNPTNGKNPLLTNRTPSEEELKNGLEYIKELKDIFEIDDKNIYAVGKKAQSILKLTDDHYIRHPSYGGASKCKERILELKIEE